jgi:hypothetical protein
MLALVGLCPWLQYAVATTEHVLLTCVGTNVMSSELR